MKTMMRGTILGGLTLFVWSFLAHLPPLGTAGERAVTPAQRQTILAGMRSMRERAVYIVADLRTFRGPTAIVAFDPAPEQRAWLGSPFATFLAIELLGALLAALFATLIATRLSPALPLPTRALILATIGLIGMADIEAGYWNWYGFPTAYFLAQLVDHGGAWLLTGFVLAWCTRARAVRN